jgi:hypothetical protein
MKTTAMPSFSDSHGGLSEELNSLEARQSGAFVARFRKDEKKLSFSVSHK